MGAKWENFFLYLKLDERKQSGFVGDGKKGETVAR